MHFIVVHVRKYSAATIRSVSPVQHDGFIAVGTLCHDQWLVYFHLHCEVNILRGCISSSYIHKRLVLTRRLLGDGFV